MRNKFSYLIIGWQLSIVLGQQPYRSVEQIQEEWTDYTSYQRDEMVTFCDFLFKESHFERCLLTSFQLLYRYPNDPLVPVVYYYIARCYEEMGNNPLAHRYYKQVMDIEPESSKAYKAALYRDTYIDLLSGNVDELLAETENTNDPYFSTFRGYAHMQNLNWEAAKISFISAEEIFDDAYYSKLMIPLYQTIVNVESVPVRNQYMVLISGSILPGGGHFLLRDWDKGKGILASVGLMVLISNWGQVNSLIGSNRSLDLEGSFLPLFKNFQNENTSVKLTGNDQIPSTYNTTSSHLRYTLPPVVLGAGIYLGSIWRSFSDTHEKNNKMYESYVQERMDQISPDRFLDFSEPSLVIMIK